jgi:hypothetical protein
MCLACRILIPTLVGLSAHASDVTDVQEIVRKATSAMQADWAAAPGFAVLQHDETASKGVTRTRTHQVFMISGSDYYMPV